jgi:helicase MOV-10
MQTYLPPTASGFEQNLPAFGPDDKIPLAFNISFMANARPLCIMEVAASTVAQSLNTKDQSKPLARQWIFPDPEDVKDAPPSMLNNGMIEDSQWLDGGLNTEQRVRFGFVLIRP